MTPVNSGHCQRFLREVVLRETQDCILWPFNQNAEYGLVRVGTKNMPASRAVCLMAHGDPPTPEHEACHSCDNKRCVNKNHLHWGTSKQNSEEASDRMRLRFGEANPQAKLWPEAVFEILESTDTVTILAKKYGVSRPAITSVLKGETWRLIDVKSDGTVYVTLPEDLQKNFVGHEIGAAVIHAVRSLMEKEQ